MKKRIEEIAKLFEEKSRGKEVLVISHFDTDGITSAAIMSKTLKKLGKHFSVKILKSLGRKDIIDLPKDKLIIFLDLASNSLNYIEEAGLKDVFIIDHHEIIKSVPPEVHMINPELHDKEKISSAGLVYLFSKELIPDSQELAKLSVIGMIGDTLEKNMDKVGNEVLNHDNVIKKRGLLIYPSTRPINRVLEYSSSPYIPEVTGDTEGVRRLLREADIKPKNGKYPSLLELEPKEMSKLVTAIMLRNPKAKEEGIIGDIYLVKMFNKLEDAREISAMINACSRMGDTNTSLQFCLEMPKAKKRAEALYIKYKQQLISGLEIAKNGALIKGNGFVIINAKDKIKDTIAGTITSIISNSFTYENGTVITTLAHTEENTIKVSARVVGREGRNVREVLNSIIERLGGEVGGHKFAAGCVIEKDKEEEFIDNLKKHLELEMVKI